MGESNNNAEAHDDTVFVRGDEVDLACHVCGPADAPVLVFVHGYPDNHRVWDRLVTELAAHYRCVRYDVRGAGESSRPTDTTRGIPSGRLSKTVSRPFSSFAVVTRPAGL